MELFHLAAAAQAAGEAGPLASVEVDQLTAGSAPVHYGPATVAAGSHPTGWRRSASAIAAGDLVALLVAFVLAATVRGAIFKGSEGPASVTRSVVEESPYAAAYLLAIWIYGLYGRRMRRMDRAWFLDFGRLLHALAIGAILTVATSAALSRSGGLPKIGWVQAIAMSAAGVLTVPTVRAVGLRLLRDRWRIRSRVVVVGSGPLLERVMTRLMRLPDVELVGTVADDPDSTPFPDLWVGAPCDLAAVCRRWDVDRVLVGFGSEWSEEAVEMVRTLPGSVRLSLVSGFSELLTWRSQVEDLHGLTLLEVPPAEVDQLHRLAKRAVDVVLSALALVALVPLFLVIGLAIVLTSRGPLLFRQERVGQGGDGFRILKFRTMTASADDLRLDLRDINEADGPMFKIRDDPRVTRVGSLLRRTSLDELPQLINVLVGHMSLVGPRPLVPEESAQIDGWASRRFGVKPGMTGLWQVSGRSDLSFEELRRLDYTYAASWSFLWDLRILCQTPGSVWRRDGAY